MRGHFNYFGVTDNSRALYQFERAVHNLLFKWLNRRSQRRSFHLGALSQVHGAIPAAATGTLSLAVPTG
jgi:hypothetical protein